jgi:intracellular septation protein A
MSEHKPNSVPSPWAGRILIAFFVLCAFFLGMDFVGERVVHHPLEEWPILYPVFGFVGISLLILIAKGLRRLVMRSEDYYGDE